MINIKYLNFIYFAHSGNICILENIEPEIILNAWTSSSAYHHVLNDICTRRKFTNDASHNGAIVKDCEISPGISFPFFISRSSA